MVVRRIFWHTRKEVALGRSRRLHNTKFLKLYFLRDKNYVAKDGYVVRGDMRNA
jgi:hypothetical protein